MKEEIKRQRELTILRDWLVGLKDVKKVNGTRNFNDVVNAVCKYTGKKRPTMMNQWYKSVQVKQYFIGKTIKNKLYIYLRADDNGSHIEQRIRQLENNIIKTYANYSNDTKKGYYDYFTEHTGFNREILNKARKEVKEMKERKNESQSNIAKKCDELKAFLLSKNEQYGEGLDSLSKSIIH
jgi:deoxyadenosine/deoxycytidine kinase